LRLNVSPIDPISPLEAAVETLRPAAEAKGIRKQKTIDTGVGAISGDPERLQQVVWNLLSNAIKFTPRATRWETWGYAAAQTHTAINDSASSTHGGRLRSAAVNPSSACPYRFDDCKKNKQGDSSIGGAKNGQTGSLGGHYPGSAQAGGD
jgi:signal transduction histidine kinase